MQTCEQLEKMTITIGGGERAIPMDAGVFLHGNCGIFAMALHERFGYSIEHVVAPADDDDDDEEDSVPGTQLVHIYCLDGDTLYDVRGGTDGSTGEKTTTRWGQTSATSLCSAACPRRSIRSSTQPL